jgi:ankyrin repeat protein
MRLILWLAILLLTQGGAAFSQEKKESPLKKDCYDERVLNRLPVDVLQEQLLEAVYTQKIDCVRTILKFGFNPNFRIKGNMLGVPIVAAALEKNAEILNELIKAGARVKSDEGNYALLTASKVGEAECAKILLETGADANAATEKGVSALMLAADNSEIVEALIKSGAKIEAVDSEERTALFYAVESTEYEKLCMLIRYGAALNLKDKAGATPISLAHNISDDEKRTKILMLIKECKAK